MSKETGTTRKIPKNNLLSFKETGRIIGLNDLKQEFILMNQAVKGGGGGTVKLEAFKRVAQKSGTHLLKMISPRTDGDAPVLRFADARSNHNSPLLPAVNAADIPFAKILFRPLEIRDHPPRSIVDHVCNPDDISRRVLDAFEHVFGEAVLMAVSEALQCDPPPVKKLAAGEFPIIFVRHPGGGDLQITPVSRAPAFMGMKRVIEPYFQKQAPNAPRVPRGRWHKQAVSAQPRNISGAIGGPRARFLAGMPPGMTQMDAELFRFVKGSRFPRWREPGIDTWILDYAAQLDADARYNDTNTRSHLDRRADRLIRGVKAFAAETLDEAGLFADRHGISRDAIQAPPGAVEILLRRRWSGDAERQRARKALSSPHFTHRVKRHRKGREG